MWYGLIGFLEWTCCKVYAFLWLSPRYFTQVGLRVDVKTSQAGWNSSECWFLDVVEKERQTPCIGDAQTCQVVSAWCNFNACHIWQAKSLWAMCSRLTELLSNHVMYVSFMMYAIFHVFPGAVFVRPSQLRWRSLCFCRKRPGTCATSLKGTRSVEFLHRPHRYLDQNDVPSNSGMQKLSPSHETDLDLYA